MLLCSTDAVDVQKTVELVVAVSSIRSSRPLFGNRDRYAQCNCTVCSWQGGVFWPADAKFFGALHTGAGPGVRRGVMSTGDMAPHN